VTTVGGEQVRAFLPTRLPPVPPLTMEGALQPLLEAAVLSVGRLDGVSTLLPDKRRSVREASRPVRRAVAATV